MIHTEIWQFLFGSGNIWFKWPYFTLKLYRPLNKIVAWGEKVKTNSEFCCGLDVSAALNRISWIWTQVGECPCASKQRWWEALPTCKLDWLRGWQSGALDGWNANTLYDRKPLTVWVKGNGFSRSNVVVPSLFQHLLSIKGCLPAMGSSTTANEEWWVWPLL